jgi:hypothetical protein
VGLFELFTNEDLLILYKRAKEFASLFQANKPFPHAVIDDFLPESSYGWVYKNFPALEDPIWKTPENVHTKAKYVARRGELGLKEAMYQEPARQILRELNSSLFLRFLELLTGIKGLVGDPYLSEAGFTFSSNGGFLDIHADFSHNDHTGLERRLNLILYLNDDWYPEYGGELVLFDGDLKPVKAVEPICNRCLIFETSKTSYHGFPDPITCPSNRQRRSLSMYYYSLPRDSRERLRVLFPSDPTFEHKVTQE